MISLLFLGAGGYILGSAVGSHNIPLMFVGFGLILIGFLIPV